MYSFRTLLELFGYALLTGCLLLALFVAGQWAKLGDLLGATGHWSEWAELMGLGGLVLLEATLPLVGLIASGLVYGRRRSEGAVIGGWALGWGPWRLYWPTIALGVVCATSAVWLAAGPVPDAIGQVRQAVARLAAAATLEAGDGVDLADGGVLRREPEGGAFWLAMSGGAGPPTLVRARSVEGRVAATRGAESQSALVQDSRRHMTRLIFEAQDVWMWGQGLRTHVQSASLYISTPELERRIAMLGPPNSLRSDRLDSVDVHHRFTWHRRLALPLMAPLWALLGGLLGSLMGGTRALLLGAGAITLSYWILRTGELSARAGFGSAALAAWTPAILLALVTWLVVRRL